MSGKEQCKILKELRKRIAEENNIEYKVKPCSFQGDCKGTCPACDKELADLTQKVNKLGLGMTAAVTISLLSLGVTGCISDGTSSYGIYGQQLGGETTIDRNELYSESETSDESTDATDESIEPEASSLTGESTEPEDSGSKDIPNITSFTGAPIIE